MIIQDTNNQTGINKFIYFQKNKMINRSSITSEWSQHVVPNYPVPENLHDHQKDTMSLLKQGKHVFLGKYFGGRVN